ncbi:hypothetical protein [Pelagicoccus sp. SDUM812005]|uniref:hypothetical protein n=1 Tax=Pelagicoccus sp. SDUM812005 TaxID=3041257 RepID=UPI00280F5A47|nr:hypothetical protein [Pelagicoccus sp. SDUM812005]MDQ8183238.1 hypothetical protein [Pelagicoccus sp. SDUM812005]
MKKTITAIASLALAATAAAHTTAVPHTHSGWELNANTLLGAAGTLALAVLAICIFRRKASRAK